MSKDKFTLYRGLHQLDNLIFTINKPIIGSKGLNYQKLVKDWKLIVGPEFANYTIPLKLNSFKHKTKNEIILYIATNNAAASAELLYSLNLIKQQVNIYFGFEFVNQIKIINSNFKIKNVIINNQIKISPEIEMKSRILSDNYQNEDDIKQKLIELAKLVLMSNCKENQKTLI